MRTLFTLVFSFSALAQTATLRGRVTDSTQAAVPQATIRAYLRDGSMQRIARSDGSGVFLLEKLPAGAYFIQAQTADLETPDPVTVTLAPGANRELDLSLAMRKLGQRMTVTAENAPVSLDQTNKAIDVVDSEEIARRQLFQVIDSVRLTAGIRVQQLGGPGALSRVITRGLRAPDTSVLIDGFRFRDVASVQGDATAFLGDLLVMNTDRVEVLRGSGSSLYGTNAAGGTMQIVTERGGGPTHGEISADGGGLGLARGVAKIGGGAGANQRFRYSAATALLNVSKGVDGYDPVHNFSGQGWAQYFLRPGTSISGRLFANTLLLMLNNSPSAGPAGNIPPSTIVPAIPNVTFIPALNDPDHRRESKFVSTMVALNQRLGSKANARIGYQALLSDRDDVNGPGGPGFQPQFRTVSGFDGRIDTIQARADWNPLRSHLIAGGYEWERESYASPSFDENPNSARRVNAETRAIQRSNSLFAQDQMRLFRERLLVSLSGRYQNFALDQPQFLGGAPAYNGYNPTSPPKALTGDASIAYLIPSTGTKIRAHVGNAYRVPSLYERFGTFFFGGTFSALGDPRLQPERSIGLDGGVDQYFASNRLRVSATYFYTRLQQVIGYGSLSNDPFGRFGGYVNVGGGLARGVELSGESKPWRGMNLRASYTYTNADERRPSLTGGVLRSLRYFPQMFTMVASQQIRKRTNVTFDFWGASDYLYGYFIGGGTRAYMFPGPRRANLAGSYTLPLSDRKSVMFFGRMENVFNQLYFEEGFQTPKVWAVGGLKFLF